MGTSGATGGALTIIIGALTMVRGTSNLVLHIAKAECWSPRQMRRVSASPHHGFYIPLSTLGYRALSRAGSGKVSHARK